MLMANSVMCPKQPCLEVREGDVDHRKVSVSSLGVAVEHQGFVRVTHLRQLFVGLPTISAHNSSLCHSLLHVPRIAPAQARETIAQGNVLVVDVRDAPELEMSGQIVGAFKDWAENGGAVEKVMEKGMKIPRGNSSIYRYARPMSATPRM